MSRIILVGGTGVGKSFISNKFFELCSKSTRFVSGSSNLSATRNMQEEVIQFQGRTFTIVDTPGFFDTNGQDSDGQNLCRLVKTFQSCPSVTAIVFMYTNRFTTESEKMWLDRIAGIIGQQCSGKLFLLHNKVEVELTTEKVLELQAEVNLVLGRRQECLHVQFNPSQEQIRTALARITSGEAVGFNAALMVIPELCYRAATVNGPQYEELISVTEKDEGKTVQRSKNTSHYETRYKWKGTFGKLFGQKTAYQEWVVSSIMESVWEPKMMSHKVIGTYVDVYKVHYDGSKVLKEKKQISTRTESIPFKFDLFEFMGS